MPELVINVPFLSLSPQWSDYAVSLNARLPISASSLIKDYAVGLAAAHVEPLIDSCKQTYQAVATDCGWGDDTGLNWDRHDPASNGNVFFAHVFLTMKHDLATLLDDKSVKLPESAAVVHEFASSYTIKRLSLAIQQLVSGKPVPRSTRRRRSPNWECVQKVAHFLNSSFADKVMTGGQPMWHAVTAREEQTLQKFFARHFDSKQDGESVQLYAEALAYLKLYNSTGPLP